MINRISTTHIKEGQPWGKYYENQKEEQAPICGEPDFSYPKGKTVPPHSPASGMQTDWFCALHPPCHPAPAALRSCPEWHLQDQSSAGSCLHESAAPPGRMGGGQESFELI